MSQKVTIHFAKKNRPSLEVESGVNLMAALLEHQVPVASSCHGEGVCSKCRLKIVDGNDHLSQISDLEIFLIEKNKYPKETRISCQVKVFGDITIDAGYW